MLGPVAGRHKKLLLMRETVCIEECVLPSVADRVPWRPLKRRVPRARAFLAKMVFDDNSVDGTGAQWAKRGDGFACVQSVCGGGPAGLLARSVDSSGVCGSTGGHNSRDATAKSTREQPAPKEKSQHARSASEGVIARGRCVQRHGVGWRVSIRCSWRCCRSRAQRVSRAMRRSTRNRGLGAHGWGRLGYSAQLPSVVCVSV